MRAGVLTPLILLGWSLQAISQSPAPAPGGQPSLQAQRPAASESELKLVVALFRHGVRAPLPGFTPPGVDKYSGEGWPNINDWNVPSDRTWGDLTIHGRVLATALGNYYAQWYTKNAWQDGFKVYLWADNDRRTIDTAEALTQGFEQGGIPEGNITLKSLPTPSPTPVDPLFHPFKAGCGTPDAKALEQTVATIKKGRQLWAQKLEATFKELYGVLDCTTQPCVPLKILVDLIGTCPDSKTFPRTCESPITWKGTLKPVTANTATTTATATGTPIPGPFAYASSASEAFLLEYANNMAPNLVGWGRVDAAKTLPSMMQLHEAYFDLTEREPYIARIQGSNLIREIRDLIRRTAETVEPIELKCLRADKGNQFIGLVGHDTNIAGVGTLLQLSWKFDDAHLPPGEHLPPDTSNLPANDALPAGALVFELRQRAGQNFVRVDYVAQSLLQMHGDPKRPPNVPFRFKITCRDESGANLYPCEMPLEKFDRLVTRALGTANPFLSRCSGDGQQICP